MEVYTFSFDITKIDKLEIALLNRGFLCFDKESEVDVKPIPKSGKNKRTEKVPFKSRARIDCALHRMKDILEYINTMELGYNHGFKQAFDFYEFLVYECIIIDCIESLAKIFGVEQELRELKKQQNVFHQNGSDWDYAEYIRSLCIAHPLETAFHPDYNDYGNFHCSETVYWDRTSQDGYDLTAIIYDPKYSDTGFRSIRLKVSQFEEFLTNCINFLDNIIEGVRKYEIVGIEKYKIQIIKRPTEYDVYSEYIASLSKEYSERGYYNQESCFSDFIKIFNTEITDEANKTKVEFYKNAIKLALSYLHKRLQNMDDGKGETTGIRYDRSYNYTELYIEVHIPDNLGSRDYDIRDGIKKHLNTRYPFPLIPENKMEAFKKWVAKFVNFKGTETDSEKYVLIMTALYLDSLNRNCILNWNIPNDSLYREEIMDDEEYRIFIEKIQQYKIEYMENDCINSVFF